MKYTLILKKYLDGSQPLVYAGDGAKLYLLYADKSIYSLHPKLQNDYDENGYYKPNRFPQDLYPYAKEILKDYSNNYEEYKLAIKKLLVKEML